MKHLIRATGALFVFISLTGQGGTVNIGAPCESAQECRAASANPVCLDEATLGFFDGYCSADGCENDADCGGDAVCLLADRETGATTCVDGCTLATECRDNYPCIDLDLDTGTTDDRVCFPICLDDSECRAGETCAFDGYCYSGSDSSVVVGDACENDDSCGPPFGVCLDEATSGLPGGYCTVPFCFEDLDCPDDALCLLLNDDPPLPTCVDGCISASDCRDGYPCIDLDLEASTTDDRVCLVGCLEDSECQSDETCGDDGMCDRKGGVDGGVVDPGGSTLDDADGSGGGCALSSSPNQALPMLLLLGCVAMVMRRRIGRA